MRNLKGLAFGEGENRRTRRKSSQGNEENQQQTQPTLGNLLKAPRKATVMKTSFNYEGL